MGLMGMKHVKPDISAIQQQYHLMEGYFNCSKFKDKTVQDKLFQTDESSFVTRLSYLWQTMLDISDFASVLLDVLIMFAFRRIINDVSNPAGCASQTRSCKPNQLQILKTQLLFGIYVAIFALDLLLSVTNHIRAKFEVDIGYVLDGVLNEGTRRNYKRRSYSHFLLLRIIKRKLSFVGRFGLFVNDNVRKGFITFVVATGKIAVLILIRSVARDHFSLQITFLKQSRLYEIFFDLLLPLFSIRLSLFIIAICVYPWCWMNLLKERNHLISSGQDLGTLLRHAVSDVLNNMFGRKDMTHEATPFPPAETQEIQNNSGVVTESTEVPTGLALRSSEFEKVQATEPEKFEIVGDSKFFAENGTTGDPVNDVLCDSLNRTQKRLALLFSWEQITIPRHIKPTRPFAYIMFTYNWIRSLMHFYAAAADIVIIIGLHKVATQPVENNVDGGIQRFKATIVLIAFITCCSLDFMIYFMCWFKSYAKLTGSRVSETFVNPVARTYLILRRGWRNFVFMFELRRSLNWTAWFGLLAFNFLYHTLWVFIIIPLELFLLYYCYIGWQLIESQVSQDIFGSYWNFLYFKIATAGIRLLLVSISTIGYPFLRRNIASHLNRSYFDTNVGIEKYLEACVEISILDVLNSQNDPQSASFDTQKPL